MGKGARGTWGEVGSFLNPTAASRGCIPFGAQAQLTDPGLQALPEGRGAGADLTLVGTMFQRAGARAGRASLDPASQNSLTNSSAACPFSQHGWGEPVPLG